MARIAYLGPPGTFTHQAAGDLIATGDELVALATAPEVVQAVDRGRADGGVVALENSLEGPVSANLDEILGTTRCLIAGERVLGVTFTLFRAAGDDAPLQGVTSHPFGLAQCARFIREHGLATQEAASTVRACESVADAARPGWGALAAPVAGDRFGLRAERERLEDDERAITRFVLLACACPPPTGRDRSAFAIRPRQDEPGSLVRLLQEFSVRGINLAAIKSRPTRGMLGEYVFYIECEGHIADERVRDAVLGLLRFPADSRFLGSFPEDRARSTAAVPAGADDAARAYAAMLDRVRDGVG